MKREEYYKSVNVIIKAFAVHMVLELAGGALGLSIGKLVLEFISGKSVESNIASDVISVFVSAIFSLLFKKHGRKKGRFP